MDKCLYHIVTYIITIPCVTISAIAVVIVYFFAAKFPKVETSKECSYLRSRYKNQPLICVGYSMHYWVPCAINKRGFFEIALKFCRRRRHTFALLWGACLCFASLWRSNSWWFMRPQTFAEVFYSVFVKRSSFKSLLNLRKAYIFQEFAEGLLSICVCWIFQNVHLSKVSAAVVPQSKSTELCSSAAVVPQSKSTEMWSSAAPFHHDLWYFRHRTNEHFRSMLFIRKNL